MADWLTFDDFVKRSRRLRFIEINIDNYKLSICSCKTWCKYYKCKHLIDLCSRLGYITYDDRVRNVPIGANHRRGNPGKTKVALVFQPNDEVETIFSASESESDDPVLTSTAKKPTKRGPKPKEVSSGSDEEDFDIFATDTASKAAKPSKETSKAKEKSKSKTKSQPKATASKKTAFVSRKK